jgi:hypothetical protein
VPKRNPARRAAILGVAEPSLYGSLRHHYSLAVLTGMEMPCSVAASVAGSALEDEYIYVLTKLANRLNVSARHHINDIAPALFHVAECLDLANITNCSTRTTRWICCKSPATPLTSTPHQQAPSMILIAVFSTTDILIYNEIGFCSKPIGRYRAFLWSYRHVDLLAAHNVQMNLSP